MMMTRSIWTLALILLTLSVPARAAQHDPLDPHIRAIESDLLADLAKGAAVSPTLQRLIDRLDSSDVVVYLMFDRAVTPNTAGRISLITAVPGRRYLRVSIDRRNVGCARLAILGHELQHAVEIADAPDAIDQESVASLYRAIGFKSETGRSDCFDSRLAIETGQQVRREVLAAAGAFGGR
jgi:hypothetical protein